MIIGEQLQFLQDVDDFLGEGPSAASRQQRARVLGQRAFPPQLYCRENCCVECGRPMDDHWTAGTDAVNRTSIKCTQNMHTVPPTGLDVKVSDAEYAQRLVALLGRLCETEVTSPLFEELGSYGLRPEIFQPYLTALKKSVGE